ncbi:ATP synthase F1 subunit epsilon [Candidatus Odyssella acanthamoebae]|uniref:ATP synthase epsilon chain n=1 Tax=Candidatus Odyssella acanthamoebae TaxID=91604 RepID=A0A077AQW8_9PROT|nr:ATP synthase F1 subunit epsilon [Candidatus Paracaedibacter acanthamoebae]AIK95572.1 ATP synthase F0F1 subunit epsilon [Candidatus Paracaedibacter acanthamoebae]
MVKHLIDEQINLNLLTPEKTLFTGEVSMVVIPAEEGELGVLPKHAPFATTLRAGEVKIYHNDNVSDVFTISGGFAEIVNNKCEIVADGILL